MAKVGTPPTHGHSVGKRTSPTYNSWSSMKARCLYPSQDNYPNYGAKGVTICDEWMSFEGFLRDMGERPPGTTLDRLDSNGNYEPSNCRWADVLSQQNNKTNTVYLNAFGETKPLMEWARTFGVSKNTLWKRLSRGWDPERALKTPSKMPWGEYRADIR